MYDGGPAGTLASSLVLSLSILLEPELMSSRDGGKPSRSQPVCELFRRPVRLAGLAVSYSKLDWLK